MVHCQFFYFKEKISISVKKPKKNLQVVSKVKSLLKFNDKNKHFHKFFQS